MRSSDLSVAGQVRLKGGTFAMGDHHDEGYRADGETPVHDATLAPFWMDETAVTNAHFARFVRDTGYITDAEAFGSSAVFIHALHADGRDVLGSPRDTPWWLDVSGADWRHPDGRHSSLADRHDHPVVHVSWRDAATFAAWAGKRLPTEAEWEFAARDGQSGSRFPWGDTLVPRGRWLANIWQGEFPDHNTAEDGFLTTSPAKALHRSSYGLWSMVGNVWEWCHDWFSPSTYQDRVDSHTTDNPTGPVRGTSRVMRGGSFLCHDSYCYRYRNSARSSNTPESSSSNIGFRCANDDP